MVLGQNKAGHRVRSATPSLTGRCPQGHVVSHFVPFVFKGRAEPSGWWAGRGVASTGHTYTVPAGDACSQRGTPGRCRDLMPNEASLQASLCHSRWTERRWARHGLRLRCHFFPYNTTSPACQPSCQSSGTMAYIPPREHIRHQPRLLHRKARPQLSYCWGPRWPGSGWRQKQPLPWASQESALGGGRPVYLCLQL